MIILLSLVLIIGSLIDQSDTMLQYKELYGPAWFNILYSLGFLNIFDSWYFIGLSVLFLINLTVCSIDRLPKRIKGIIAPETSFNEIFNKNLTKAKYYKLTSLKDKNTVLSETKKLFSKKFGKPVEKSDNGGSELYFSKNAALRLSPYIIHLSIIIILIGVMLSVTLGYRAYVNIDEGQTVHHAFLLKNNQPVRLPFGIRLDRYVTKYYPDGIPKSYISTLSITKKHVRVLTKKIRVNHPLRYEHHTIYQASFGHYKPDAVKLITINMHNIQKNKTQKPEVIYAEVGKLYKSPVKNLRIKLMLIKNTQRKTGIFPLYLSVYKPNDKKPVKNILFSVVKVAGRKTPLVFTKYSDTAFVFGGIKGYFFSGLEITKNAYTWVVWTGSIIMMIALFFAFFFNAKELWIKVSTEKKAGGNTNTIEIIAMPHKKFISFYNNIEQTINRLKNII